jgi:hypothetical protein
MTASIVWIGNRFALRVVHISKYLCILLESRPSPVRPWEAVHWESNLRTLHDESHKKVRKISRLLARHGLVMPHASEILTQLWDRVATVPLFASK